MWPPSSRPTLGYSLPSEMGMFVVAPATSFHHNTNVTTNNGPSDTLIHHHDPHHHSSIGVGVIPLLTATPCLNVSGFESEDLIGRTNRTGAIHLWQTTHQQQQQVGTPNNMNINYSKKSINFDQSSGVGGTATCQDCGNQAKKDCSHRRCRTCCRSRGLDCNTHLKSTWVPAARRRERQMIGAPVAGGGGGGASSGSTSGAKKPRLISSQNTATTSHTSTSNTPPRSFDTTSSHQDASFKDSLPGQVKAPAVFKCVRVTAVEGGEDEFAYQAVVKIGGHVFKGFLYDQGIEPREGFPNLSELHLGGGATSSAPGVGTGGRSNPGVGSSTLLDPNDVYGGGGVGALLGGSSYGHTIT